MAYVVVYHKDEEIDRRPLEGDLVIGRSTESDIAVRDVLLSRHHCRIERDGRQWVIVDLGSKNGTRIGGNVVSRQTLQEGDVVRMGKTTLRFFHGTMKAGSAPKPKSAGAARPNDPFEALSSTVSAFEFQPRGRPKRTDNLPTPRPSPLEPASYTRSDVRGLVSELVSSSWDSIYDNAKRPDPVMPQSPLVEAVRRRRAREPHADLALQVRTDAAAPSPSANPAPPRLGVLAAPRPPRWRIRSLLRRLAMFFELLAVLLLVRP